MPRASLAAILTLALFACAGPTPYAPADGRDGWTQERIEDDRYRVTFSGNWSTPRETVENYMLYRAAELTLEQGRDHFVVSDSDVEREVSFRPSPSARYLGGHGFFGHHPHGFHRHGHVGSFHAWHFHTHRYGLLGPGHYVPSRLARYKATANVVLREGDEPEDDPDAYDARDVIERLGSTIVRPEGAEQAAKP